ncbi:PREDICTED: von Willebrand factor A domain-containing protein 2 [Myotis brandtii]|uniref:von Willebrand factor A domain-containing protein 2 n=1 Tax=Myotis brandtii TaxID=109478 RepID=UPI000703D7C5|nr:PREDICTED: von Willebrand factor A domain-containing protein 2 [Myotis brandtii]
MAVAFVLTLARSCINMPSVLLLEAICICLLAGAPPSLPLQEVHVSRETLGKISAASKTVWCSAAVDVLFLIDGSHSIGKGSFERAKHFAITVCAALDIHPERVRVGAVQFSSAPWLEFPLDSLSTQQEVKTKLKRMVFKGGRTETGLALKYFLRRGFPGGRNASVPQVLIIITDGRSQGQVALPAKQLQERGVTVFAVGVHFPRWEELHTLASEPREQHVLMAEQVEDATNGLFSALSSSDFCTFASPDCRVQPHPCERKTLETVRELVGSGLCWRGSRGTDGVLAAPCPFFSWKRVFLTHPATCYRTTCPGPCDSQPCRNGGTCVPEGLDRYHCLCPPAFREEANCAPTLSLACRIDVLFLLASSAGTTLEGFLRAKAFVKRFAQASLNEDSRARVGVAWYSGELEVAVPVGEYLDVSAGTTLEGFLRAKAFVKRFAQASLNEDSRARVGVAWYSGELEVAVPVGEYLDVPDLARQLLLLGLGSEAVRAELEEITGSPEHVMVYADPQDLFHQIPDLQGKLCSRPQPGETQGPVPRAASAGPRAGGQWRPFLMLLPLNQGLCLGAGTPFNNMGSIIAPPGGLLAVPAQKLRDNGVSVLVVGVGPVLSEALRRLAGPRDALIHVAAYTDLRFHRDALIEWLCEEANRPVNLCKPSPCMHEGTCVLRNGSYLCACRDGWEGPHCENREWVLAPRG